MLKNLPSVLTATAAAVTLGVFTFGPAGGAGTSADAGAGSTPAVEPVSVQTTEIDCGGYDADGEVVTPEATRIDTAPVGPDGVPRIPAVCGGYTTDGHFIGDD